jgi:hypothetical protein
MGRLTVLFFDDEVIEGTADDATLNSPDIHLQVAGTSNNSRAWIPLPAVKKIHFDAGPADAHASTADNMVALHFQDGEVVRGYLNGGLDRRRYGLVLTLYSPDRLTMEKVGIPYTSLKAMFYLRAWDGRPLGFREEAPVDAPLLELLGDIHEVTRMYHDGSLTRREFMVHRRRLLDHF